MVAGQHLPRSHIRQSKRLFILEVSHAISSTLLNTQIAPSYMKRLFSNNYRTPLTSLSAIFIPESRRICKPIFLLLFVSSLQGPRQQENLYAVVMSFLTV